MKTKLLIIFLLIAPLSVFSQNLDPIEQKLLEKIEKNYEETVKLLEETVNINSGTFNLEGVKAVAKVYEREFAKIGFQTEWVTGK